MTNTNRTLEIFAINDDEESDADPIMTGSHDDMIRLFGDVSLDFLYDDDGAKVYNVVRDDAVIAVAYAN